MALTAEERNDLRRRVLADQPLTLDEAKAVIESLRAGAGVAVLAGEAKATRGKREKKSLSDEEFNKELNDLGL